MSIIKTLFVVAVMLLLGATGALIFNTSLLPYFLASAYFDDFKFVKDYKEGKIVVNKTEQVYIQENTAIENAIERVKSSIVVIGVPSAQTGKTIISGLIVTSDGTIITLANAVPTGRQAIPADGNFKVFLQGESINFKVVKTDNKNNLALLKIEKSNLQTVGFASIDKIKLGQKVFLTAPTEAKQDNWFANEGIIREIDTEVIKTNISERPIANGSPLLNLSGELVGLNFIGSENKISAIPINKIQELLGL
jgi:S1-C subfamily serine protease